MKRLGWAAGAPAGVITPAGESLPVIDLGAGRSALALVVGGAHTCALLDDRSVKCWGDNDAGQLGLGDTTQRGSEAGQMGDNLPTVMVP